MSSAPDMIDEGRAGAFRLPADTATMPGRTLAMALIGVPCVFGFVMGVNRVAFAQHLGPFQAIFFWVGMSLLVWTAFYLATTALTTLGRNTRVPVPVLAGIGAILASFPLKPVVYLYADVAAQIAGTSARPRALPPFAWSPTYFEAHLAAWSGAIALWIIGNFVWQRFSGARPDQGRGDAVGGHVGAVPGQAHAAAPMPPLSAAGEVFRKRLGGLPLGDIFALSSEDHFVRVHQKNRETLVYGRLSDAIDAMQGIDGLRLHRSYWVARKAIIALRSADKTVEVRLANGAILPVSRSYREDVRRAGLTISPQPVVGKGEEHPGSS